jgi:hypothetical protein
LGAFGFNGRIYSLCLSVSSFKRKNMRHKLEEEEDGDGDGDGERE